MSSMTSGAENEGDHAIKTQFYGMRELVVNDPDGHIITFAERVG